MKTTLTIQNYRCFVQPARIELNKAFTAFVGANNAGKSSAMRFLLELRNLFSFISQPNMDGLISSLRSGGPKIQLLHVADGEEIFSNLNTQPIKFTLDFEYEEGGQNRKKPSRVEFEIARNLIWTMKLSPPLKTESAMHANGTVIRDSPGNQVDVAPLFEAASILSNTIYIGPFRNTINVGTKTDYLDIQIGESFIKNFRALKTGASKKNSAAISDLTSQIRHIFGFESLDIAPSADDTSLHITINEKPFKQHELGSGLSQFIVVLANASIKRPKLLLIDEPESNLHPSLQLDFLTALGTYASEGVWFSTHSLGLARTSAETIYSVAKIKDGDSILRPLEGTPRLPEFLGELSFSSHRELGFESLLLVEGPTEVKVFQHFLRLLQKEHRYVILPMHGHLPSVNELDELLRITPSATALIDSERSSNAEALSPSRQAFLDLCSRKNLRAHVLERRATENYFPDSVVKKVFGPAYRALSPYELLKDASPNWSKSQNWKLAIETSLDDLEKTDLGKFLKQL